MNLDERIPIDAFLVPRDDVEFKIMIISLCEPDQYGMVRIMPRGMNRNGYLAIITPCGF
jgi:hypothetical protein